MRHDDDGPGARPATAGRRWALRWRSLLGGIAVAVFVVVGGLIGTVSAAGSSVVVAAVFFVPYWAIMIGIGVTWSRTATSMELAGDGGLRVRAPARVLLTHATRVTSLRCTTQQAPRACVRFVLDTLDGRIAVPPELVEDELLERLRAAAPHAELPARNA